MAEKNWLIRTKKKQLLGPVTKQKVIDFVQKGALSDGDEISSGNGYWFAIREKDLLDKYIHGDLPQTFNPITEAPNVLTVKDESNHTSSLNPNTMPAPKANPAPANDVAQAPSAENLDYPDMGSTGPEETKLPTSDDLDFPDMGDSGDTAPDQVLAPSDDDLEYPDMGGVEAPQPKAPSAPVTPAPAAATPAPTASPSPVEEASAVADGEALIPNDDDLEYPSLGEDISFKVDIEEQPSKPELPPAPVVQEDFSEDVNFTEVPFDDSVETKKKTKPSSAKKKSKKVKTSSGKKKVVPKRNDAIYLTVFFVLVLGAIGGVYYYYTKILNKEIVLFDNIEIMRSVNAQSLDLELSKKKI